MPVVKFENLDFSKQVITPDCTYSPRGKVRKNTPVACGKNNYFYKDLQGDGKIAVDKRIPEGKVNHRLLCEAIAGTVVRLTDDKQTVITPTYELVVTNKKLVGLLTNNIGFFENIEDLGSSELLKKKNFGRFCAQRFFLMDSDGESNVGYNVKGEACTLDYGLALCSYLNDAGALSNSEKEERVPEPESFTISETSIVKGILQPAESNNFLVHHKIYGFAKQLAKQNAELTKQFFSEIYQTLKQIVDHFSDPKFVERVKAELGYEELEKSDQVIFDEVLGQLVNRAAQLKVEMDKLPEADYIAKMNAAIGIAPQVTAKPLTAENYGRATSPVEVIGRLGIIADSKVAAVTRVTSPDSFSSGSSPRIFSPGTSPTGSIGSPPVMAVGTPTSAPLPTLSLARPKAAYVPPHLRRKMASTDPAESPRPGAASAPPAPVASVSPRIV